MKRTQLYLEEEIHQVITLFAKSRGWSLSRAVREALKEYTEKLPIKKAIKQSYKTNAAKHSFSDMAGIITSGDPNMSKNINDIYNEV